MVDGWISGSSKDVWFGTGGIFQSERAMMRTITMICLTTICVSWRLRRLLRVSLNIIESLSQRLLLLLVSYCFILLKVLWHLPTSKQCPIESQNISQPLKDYVLDVFSSALASFPRNNSYRKQPPQPHLFNRGASVWRGLWRVPWIKSWMSEQLQSEVLWRDRTNGIEDLMIDQFAGSEYLK